MDSRRILTHSSDPRRCRRTGWWLAVLGMVFGGVSAQAAWENGQWAILYEAATAANDVRSCSDGMGGTIVALVDPGGILPIMISRVDHTGTELWGDGGIGLPWSVGASAMTGPLDVAPDGAGGAFIAYREIWGSQHIVTVRHVTWAGAHEWRTYVADSGDPGSWALLHVELQSTGNGEVILAWTNAVMADRKVKLARVTAAGAIQWQAETPAGLLITTDRPHWCMETDGGDGVLLACRQQPSGYPLWTWLQRIDGAGQKQWGVNGVQLATWVTDLCPIQADGTGGVYFAMHDGVGGVTRAQHLAWNGLESWPTGGVNVLPYGAAAPMLCGDGANGLYVLESAALDIHAQRVDWYGNPAWGTSGIVVAGHAGLQNLDSVVADGFGGFIAGYTDSYFGSGGGDPNRVPSGVRVNGFGWKDWEAIGLWMGGYNDGMEPHRVRAVSDGSGGAQFSWSEYYTPTTDVMLYGVGVGPTGGAPAPTVTYMWPPSGTPGEVLGVLVLGDYLEASQSFQLQRAGAPTIPITSPILLNYQAVWGGLDLAAAIPGPYDLAVSVGGVPADVLSDAFGVGEPPPCGTDEIFYLGGQGVGLTSGSQRKAAFDSQGRMWMAWLQQAASAAFVVEEWCGYPNGAESVWTLRSPSYRPWDLSFAIGPDDLHHIVWVEERSGQRYLVYLRGPGEGTAYQQFELLLPNGIWNPVLAALPGGAACIVYENVVGGVRSLYYLNASVGSGLQGPYTLNAGTNATRPDLVAYNGDLMLTYVRDFWLPGNREVCYQRRSGGIWGAPGSIYFGVDVWSPSVASDGSDGFLFAFGLDNTGANPLIHTCRMEDGALDPVRWWYPDGALHSVSVCGNGPGSYYLMSEETAGGPVNIYLRATNGAVLYPQKKLNTSQQVDLPFFTARYGSQAYGAWWEEYDENLLPLHRAICFTGESAVPEVAGAAELSLSASPNPASGGTTISYVLPSTVWVRLELFDVGGRKVRTLADGIAAPGAHEVTWDARDERGAPLYAGIYFARLRLGDGSDRVTKLTLLR